MVFAQNAVTIKYQADSQLNLVNNRPHSLLLVVYQLSSLNTFNSYAGYKDGVVKLLAGKSFDKSIASVHKEYIEPGSNGSILLNRAEGARYVAVVGGFNDLIPTKCSILVEITTETSRHGIWLTKRTTVNPLTVNLVLEKDGLRLKKADNDS